MASTTPGQAVEGDAASPGTLSAEALLQKELPPETRPQEVHPQQVVSLSGTTPKELMLGVPLPREMPMMMPASSEQGSIDADAPMSSAPCEGPDSDIADIVDRITRHLDISLRNVVHQCLGEQTVQLVRDLRASVEALQRLVPDAESDDEGGQSLSETDSEKPEIPSDSASSQARDVKPSVQNDKGNAQNPSSGNDGVIAAKGSVGYATSCPDLGSLKKPKSILKLNASGKLQKSNKATSSQRLGRSNQLPNPESTPAAKRMNSRASRSSESLGNQSLQSEPKCVGMAPEAALKSVKLERMSLKSLESRLVSDLFSAKSIALPEDQDVRKPQAKVQRTVKIDTWSVDNLPNPSGEEKSAILPRIQEKRGESSMADESVDPSDRSFSLCPNLVLEMGEEMQASRKSGKLSGAGEGKIPDQEVEKEDEALDSGLSDNVNSTASVRKRLQSKKSRNTRKLRRDRQEQLTEVLGKGVEGKALRNAFVDEQATENSDSSEMSWLESCMHVGLIVGNAGVRMLICIASAKDNMSFPRPAVIAFQLLLLVVASLSFASSLQQAGFIRWDEDTIAESDSSLQLFSDLAIGMGAILGLLTSQLHTARSGFETLLRNYAEQRNFRKDWMRQARLDFVLCLACWIVAVAERTRSVLAWRQEAVFGQEIAFSIVSFSMSSLLLISQLFHVTHICRGLHEMLDDFSFRLVSSFDLSLAEEDWNVLQALLRKGCASLQLLFVVLQSTMVATVTLAVTDIISDQGRATALIAGGIVLLGLAQMFLRASAVTDHCERLPAFVNSLYFGCNHDPGRMYLVQYMTYSQAGFYVFEVRLTSDLVLKFFYVICMALFAVATKVMTSV